LYGKVIAYSARKPPRMARRDVMAAQIVATHKELVEARVSSQETRVG
jgi:hypothetical protein